METRQTSMKKRNLPTASSWASLPEEILVTIAERLTAPDGLDFVRFGAVCTSWHSAAACTNFTLVRQMPWVMLPPTNECHVSCTSLFLFEPTNYATETLFFSPSENKLYKLPLPEARWKSLCGSVKGWVATLEHDCRIHLLNLNPFTRQPRRCILPSLHDSVDDQPDPEEYGRYIVKLCLPSSPTEDPKGVAVAIYGLRRLLAFTWLGSRSWIAISCSLDMCDVVSYKKRFYAVNIKGDVMKLNFQQRKAVKIASGPMGRPTFSCLVESAGELLQVVECPESKRVKVFKLHLMSREWEVVKSLGERSIFLSVDSYSMSVSAPQLFGCRSNCIYFISDGYLDEDREKTTQDMLVYSLEEEKVVNRQDMGQTCKSWGMRPVWVSPFDWWQKS